MGFSVAKVDVSGAFLQSRESQRDLWVLPAPELAAPLNVAQGEIVKLKMAAYGTGRGSREMVPQHIYSVGRTRVASPELRPVLLEID